MSALIWRWRKIDPQHPTNSSCTSSVQNALICSDGTGSSRFTYTAYNYPSEAMTSDLWLVSQGPGVKVKQTIEVPVLHHWLWKRCMRWPCHVGVFALQITKPKWKEGTPFLNMMWVRKLKITQYIHRILMCTVCNRYMMGVGRVGAKMVAGEGGHTVLQISANNFYLTVLLKWSLWINLFINSLHYHWKCWTEVSPLVFPQIMV